MLSSGFVAFFGSRQPDGLAIEIRRDDRVLYDSPLEGGVYCELVSEVGLRRLANKARFQGVYG
jgi:hypothetical protein